MPTQNVLSSPQLANDDTSALNDVLVTDGAGVNSWVDVSTITPKEPVIISFSQGDIAADTWAFMDGLILCAADIGWIPMRACSVTGMSVQVGAALGGIGSSWDIEVYVNTALVWADTLSTAGDTQIAFQTQADGTDSVAAGQVVSVHFNQTGGADNLVEPHVLIELTYD